MILWYFRSHRAICCRRRFTPEEEPSTDTVIDPSIKRHTMMSTVRVRWSFSRGPSPRRRSPFVGDSGRDPPGISGGCSATPTADRRAGVRRAWLVSVAVSLTIAGSLRRGPHHRSSSGERGCVPSGPGLAEEPTSSKKIGEPARGQLLRSSWTGARRGSASATAPGPPGNSWWMVPLIRSSVSQIEHVNHRQHRVSVASLQGERSTRVEGGN
jgi:hypothetical protein